MSQLNSKVEKESKWESSLPLCSFSIQALNGLYNARPHWGEQPALLSIPIKMLIFSENAFIDALQNNV